MRAFPADGRSSVPGFPGGAVGLLCTFTQSWTQLTGGGYAFDLPPGVSHVNIKRGSSFSQLDLRASKQFWFAKDIGLEVLAEVFNVLNVKNPAGYVGNILAKDNQGQSLFATPSTYAGDPGQGEQRLLQLGLRVHF